MKFEKEFDFDSSEKGIKISEKTDRKLNKRAGVGVRQEDNKYNDSGAEELVGGQEYAKELEDRQRVGGKFIKAEDVSDESKEFSDEEGYIMNEIEIKAEEAIAKKFDSDVYDFVPIINKLFESLREKDNKKNKWHRERDFDRLFDKINLFLVKYREILAKKLPEEVEYPMIHKAFKKIVGDLVYSGSKIDILNHFAKIRNGHPKKAKVNEKVFSSVPAKAKNSNKKGKNYGRKNTFNGKGLKVFNPRTGKTKTL